MVFRAPTTRVTAEGRGSNGGNRSRRATVPAAARRPEPRAGLRFGEGGEENQRGWRERDRRRAARLSGEKPARVAEAARPRRARPIARRIADQRQHVPEDD